MNFCFVLSLFFLTLATSEPIVFELEQDRLTFTANWMEDISALDQYIPQYLQLLKSKKIKNLSLSFAYCKDPEYILKKIFTFPLKLQSLSVNLDTCKVGDQGVNQLLNQIDPNQIEELHLILSSSGVTEKIGRIIGEAVGKLINLKAFKLGLMMVKIGDQGLTDLFLNPLGQQIRELSLDLTSCKLGIDSFKNFSTFVSRIQAENLKKIDLIVRGNRLQANSTMDIAKSLKRFVFIQNFKFDAYFNNLKSKGVKPISLLLKRLSELKVLVLDFDLNYIETEGGRMIGEALINKTHLEYLEIGVSTKNFGYNGYNHILKGMMELHNLRYLSFRCGVNRIGIKAADDFKELLSQLPNLQYLQLYLVQNLMRDEGINVLAESIGRLAHLKTLKLNFGFNEVKNEGMKTLLKMVNEQNLTNIWIGLSNNPIEDIQIREIIPFVQNIFQSCSNFEFELLYTKVSEDLASQLKQMFAKAQSEKTCNAIIHVNSEEEIKRTKAEIERQDDEDRKRKGGSQQL